MQVVAEVSDGQEALKTALEVKPDVAILDICMPHLNGIETTASLIKRCPETRVIVLSMHSDTEYVHRALAAGVSAYILKGAAGEEVVKAISAVLKGEQYFSPGLTIPAADDGTLAIDKGPLASLSVRERQVLQLVVEGYSSAKIAALVHLSPKSIDTYRSRLMKKLGVSDVTALVKFAIQHGITSLQ